MNALTLEKHLNHLFELVFTKLGFPVKYAVVQRSNRPELSQFQCNAAMPLAKQKGQPPFVIAEQIVQALQAQSNPCFSDLSVVKPGFINITLSDEFLCDWVQQIAADQRFGVEPPEQPKKVVIDFGGPNVAKPMHVGHIRSTLIGDSLQRVYRFVGDSVVSDVHLGDWGTQMGMLIEAVREKWPDLVYFDPDFQGPYPEQSPVSVDQLSILYPEASSRCKTDEQAAKRARQATAQLQEGRRGYQALWKHFVNVSVEALKKDFDSLGVNFDLWLGESDAQPWVGPLVEQLLEQGYAAYSQGAVVVPFDDDQLPPLILKKSDGAVMYGTTDLATIQARVSQLQADAILYVVDKRQSLHFKQVFTAAKQCQIAPKTDLTHIGFGTVNGPDGKPFKTRGGGVMRLSALIEEAKSKASLRSSEHMSIDEHQQVVDKVALATIKFADLVNPYMTDYVFNLDKVATYEGKTGPYLLYSAVRIKSLLRRAEMQVSHTDLAPADSDVERQLYLTLAGGSNAISKTYEQYAPHHLCEQAYTLAVAFNKFYADTPILQIQQTQQRRSKLALCQVTLYQLTLLLDLLGIEIPEKM